MMHPFTWLFLAFLALGLALRGWLNLRQVRHVRAHRDAVPEPFDEAIPLEQHRKAADYTVAKARIGRWDMLLGAVVLLGFTLGGGIDAIDALWQKSGWHPYLIGAGVIISIMLISSLIELPLSIYSTFGVEQRFGFNRTTPGLFIADLFKGLLLSLLLGVPLLLATLWFMDATGKFWWLWVWALWTGFSLFLTWAYPAFIAPLFNRFSPLADEALRERIERLLARCGFESSGVFVMDGSRRSAHGNAYFTGMGRSKRIVFFDTLLEDLSHEEIEAVLAHELGHFKLRHITRRLVISATVSLLALALLGWLVDQPWFYAALGISNPAHHNALLIFLLVLPVFTWPFTPLSAMYSRKHEFEADAFATEHADARALETALVSLYRENASTLTPDPLHSAFYDSHPPAATRIRHLRERHA
ncbi:MAG TPA: M48 family metallopeptidase [Gammaproteobacteria bacterium]|nr:M48 family metallopeptidase [Gammaproteobacteria bacterium]